MRHGNRCTADTPKCELLSVSPSISQVAARKDEYRPKVSQSPTSVLQLPTRWTLFSGVLAIFGYHLPTRSTYSSTLSGLTSWKTIEWTYLPLANTCEKERSISLSSCWPSGVP
jgi:hypothetical protein